MIHPLKEGTYKLTRDIENPKPGRRANYDWRTEKVYKKGRYFIVKYQRYSSGEEETFMDLRTHGAGSFTITVHSNPALFGLLVAHLEPVKETPTDYLERMGWKNMAGDVLDKLHSRGEIHLSQVEEALEDILGEPPPEDE